jgi:hypothetical protein
MYLRSIDDEWEGGDIFVLDPCQPFRKVINKGRTYLVKVKFFTSLAQFFQGKTAVKYDKEWLFYNFSGDDVETDYDNDIPRIKSTDSLGKCVYLTKEKCQYITFSKIEKKFSVRDGFESNMYFSVNPEYHFYLDLLSQYDEPKFAEY